MIDKEGYRENVGIVICNDQRKVLWARRTGEEAWQFPQGGINKGESAEEAMYRELKEEVGLDPHNVEILARTKGWLKYDVPKSWIRRDCRDRYRGQKQIWFLLRFTGKDSDVFLKNTEKPEFDDWRWDSFWAPVDQIIDFKKAVYEQALKELFEYLPSA
ncbi:MAG: RNA pyrophosphohydrolase [Nitrosomonadales bacterium]|jgi:putative (di)nucleoside polyphosphate hydrolase|nr:RNA pyrophosphohydrolase [Nitrosomonadales bacterium]|tara:strand:- start:5309 stop:5785 length:477 start_codon:yes stop_codon:yes gene_type:complete